MKFESFSKNREIKQEVPIESNVLEPKEKEVHLDAYFNTRKETLNIKRLQESSKIAFSYIKDHVEELGIEITNFNPEAILYEELREGVNGCYNAETNTIKISDPNEDNLRLIIHEQLHYSASTENKSESTDFNGQRFYQSGFHSIWKPKKGEEVQRDILRSLNEAITERMARELFQDNKDRFLKDFKDRCQSLIDEKIKLAKEKRAHALGTLEDDAKRKYDVYLEYSMDQELDLDYFKREFQDLADKKYEHDIKDASYENFIAGESKSYEQEIQILNAILEKTSDYDVKKYGMDKEMALGQEWIALKKAYFSGNTMYLRRIDKIVGKNTLALFNQIDRSSQPKEEFMNKTINLMDRINK